MDIFTLKILRLQNPTNLNMFTLKTLVLQNPTNLSMFTLKNPSTSKLYKPEYVHTGKTLVLKNPINLNMFTLKTLDYTTSAFFHTFASAT